MNRVLEPTTTDKRKKEIAKTKLLNKQFLFTGDNRDFFIKYEDKLIPIAGHLKQFVLEAGSNLEIVFEETDTEKRHPVLRLKDDIGIDTWTLAKWYEKREFADQVGISSTIYFVIQDKQNIYLKSSLSDISKSFLYMGIPNTGNLEEDVTGNQWYEMSLDDFREITGIPYNTGSNLDDFGEGSYVYWDIYINAAETAFSVDRVFVTHQKVDTEDEIVSEGRVFCHDPWWMTPNDKHTVDVSDGFTLPTKIFNSESANEPFTKGEQIEICSVYKTVPGGVVKSEIIKNPYPRFKGMVKLGEVENTTFFPLIPEGTDKALVGGQFLIKTTRNGKTQNSVYAATVTNSNNQSIFGSDARGVKMFVSKVESSLGNYFGLKTAKELTPVYETEVVEGGEEGLSKEIYFVIQDHHNIYFESDNGRAAFTFIDMPISSNEDNNEYGCHMYELSLGDFRRITGIPLDTGSDLDDYPNTGYVYFDIWINANDYFSIDRAFITHTKANTEQEMVSDGKIWVHNPWWMTPYDESKVDVGDGFIFLDNIFDDSANNAHFERGEKIKIMDVYMTIPGHTTTIVNTTYKNLPPEKMEVWFNGWDTRSSSQKTNLKSISEDSITSFSVLSRD